MFTDFLTPFQVFVLIGAVFGVLAYWIIRYWLIYLSNTALRQALRELRGGRRFNDSWKLSQKAKRAHLDWSRRPVVFTVASMFACMLVVPMTVGPFFYDFAWGGTVFYKQSTGEVLKYVSSPRTFWESGPIFDETVTSTSTRPGHPVSVHYTPPASITTNPHVLWQEHRIEVVRIRDPEAAVKWTMWVRVRFGNTEDFVRHHIIEFVRQYSELLAELDNPYTLASDGQPSAQERYQSMVRGYFEPVLVDAGLELVSARFELKQP